MRVSDWRRIAVLVVLATVLLALPRWAHHTPDSKRYLAVAEWLCGDASHADLVGPFAYRLLTPALTCALPGVDRSVGFAVENIIWTAGGILLSLLLLARFGASRAEVAVGALVLTCSFPTFNYASAVLTDPAGFFFLVLGLLLVQAERWWAVVAVSCVGIWARETNLVLPVIAILMLVSSSEPSPRTRAVHVLAFLLLPACCLLIARVVVGEVPALASGPSLARLRSNLLRPVSWATVLLTIGPFLVGLALRWNAVRACYQSYVPRDRRLILVATLTFVALFVADLFAAFMSGRFLWPLYPVLAPLVTGALRGTRLERLALRIVLPGASAAQAT